MQRILWRSVGYMQVLYRIKRVNAWEDLQGGQARLCSTVQLGKTVLRDWKYNFRPAVVERFELGNGDLGSALSRSELTVQSWLLHSSSHHISCSYFVLSLTVLWVTLSGMKLGAAMAPVIFMSSLGLKG